MKFSESQVTSLDNTNFSNLNCAVRENCKFSKGFVFTPHPIEEQERQTDSQTQAAHVCQIRIKQLSKFIFTHPENRDKWLQT